MLDRIRISLAHPRLIGLFYKDKLHVPILYTIFFFLLFITVALISNSGRDYTPPIVGLHFAEIIEKSDDKLELSLNDNKLSGSIIRLNSSSYELSFLDDSEVRKGEILSLHFLEDEIKIYFDSALIRKINYKDLNLSDFKISSVSALDNMSFIRLTNKALDLCNRDFYLLDTLSGIISILTMYIIVLLGSVLISYFVNSDITANIRIRLDLYCSLSYFLFIIFSIAFSSLLFELLALVVPLIYTRMCFSRIVRVRVKKN